MAARYYVQIQNEITDEWEDYGDFGSPEEAMDLFELLYMPSRPYLTRIYSIDREAAALAACPACNEADLEEYGSKHRCPVCRYIEPCCTTDCPVK